MDNDVSGMFADILIYFKHLFTSIDYATKLFFKIFRTLYVGSNFLTITFYRP